MLVEECLAVAAGIVGVVKWQATLLSGLVLLLTHIHGAELTSMPMLPAVLLLLIQGAP